MKKILLISNMYPSDKYPSYGIFVKKTNDILKSYGYKVEKSVMYKSEGNIKKMINYLIFYLFSIVKIIFQNYDCIYVHYATHSSIPVIIANLFKKNLVVCTNVHGSDIIHQKKSQIILDTFVKKIFSISKIIITPSEYYKKVVVENYNVDISKIKVFQSGGIDRNIFYRDDENRRYIGYVGRLEKSKGWETFLNFIYQCEKIEMYRDYKYLFVGDGSDSEKFDKKIKELGLEKKIEKYKLVDQQSLKKIYNKLEFLVFPSISESLGLVGIECMACGTPVIGSKIEALQEYIKEDYSGYLFEINNVKELLFKSQKYISKSERDKEQIRLNCVKISAKYDSILVGKKLNSIFYEI